MNIRTFVFASCLLGVFALAPGLPAQPAPGKLQLKPGDHIALIGNALPDRMQHSGYFETFLQAQFPQHHLVVRNLAAAGDEVVIRHRSENFGAPDDWLNRTKADVIFAFFGFNESFKGYAGLEKFRGDLDKFLLIAQYSVRFQPHSGSRPSH